MPIKRLALSFLLLLPAAVSAQWTHRYPPVDGFNHHVYLEGYELPILTAGPMDPAPSPTGGQLAFAARGWLWLLDLETGNAHRITHSAGIDARPEWSADGGDLVFTRDQGRRLSIVTLNLASGEERVLVDSEAINLDPVFAPDERYVYYASAEGGPLELWRVAVDSGQRERITHEEVLKTRPLKRRPLLLDPDSLIVYLDKQGTTDSIKLLNTRTHAATTLVQDRITAQADMALSPDGKYLAYIWPFDGGWELRLLAIAAPDTSVLLTQGLGLPLAPAFSADGQWIYFAEADDDQRMQLKRISVNGGGVETVRIADWDWGVPTGSLTVRTRIDGQPAPARLSVLDASGHPVVPDAGMVHSEGQHGRVFYYSDGELELVVPAGQVTVAAVQGLATPEADKRVAVRKGRTTEVTLDLEPVWDAPASGWYAGDDHFHVNYGGTYRLVPADILPELRGEGMDLAWPLLANLHNRFLGQNFWGWSYIDGPIIRFGQEVRSHFLGHVGLIGTQELFWPWVWGPFYQVYGQDDRPNSVALRFARAHGGIGGYVHPVDDPSPFTEEAAAGVPIGLVADAVLGDVDYIEVACLWSDEIGTAALWHRLLNIGIPVAPSAGSDVMNNYYRTMAIGATRVYVKPDGDLDSRSYLRALAAGRSFVSNGPLVEFTVAGREPGQTVDATDGDVDWALDVHSALPYDKVEIFVNGAVAATLDGSDRSGSRHYQGTVAAPAGGWITARVVGTDNGWPAMDSYLFAETAPVWFGAIGSTEPAAAREAAQDLLMVLEVSERNLKAGYGTTPIPSLVDHFDKAKARLQQIAKP